MDKCELCGSEEKVTGYPYDTSYHAARASGHVFVQGIEGTAYICLECMFKIAREEIKAPWQ